MTVASRQSVEIAGVVELVDEGAVERSLDVDPGLQHIELKQHILERELL